VAGRCNASQDAQDTWDAGDASLASGRNADGSDAGSVFADVISLVYTEVHRSTDQRREVSRARGL